MIILEGTGPDHQAHGPAADRPAMSRAVAVKAGSGNRQNRRILTMFVYADCAAKPGFDHPTVGLRRVVSKIAVADGRVADWIRQADGAAAPVRRAILAESGITDAYTAAGGKYGAPVSPRLVNRVAQEGAPPSFNQVEFSTNELSEI